ncbi:HipA family kinase [Anaerobacillus sp. MEB173]|uniref:HipA family kinase n=1 Tax=Anaerobacillus sp. MEB173 TaxID=3383345 RepID=UPI003F920CB4
MNHFNIPTYDILSFEREIGNGVTNPLLMRTQHDLYVVKTIDHKEEPKVLINELVCYKLAKLLDIPIPDVAVVNISQHIIQSTPKLIELGVQPGKHFGSKFVSKAQPNLQPPMLRIATNLEDIPSIILFDQIIYNDDRTTNRGNLLFDLKQKRLLAIDHSHVFKIGALWDEVQLKRIHEEGICLIKEFHGHNYKVLLKYVNGNNPFNKVLQKVSELTIAAIEWCVSDIPDEWGLTDGERGVMIEFIWYRIENVAEILKLLKDQCPDWKGGDLSGF